MNKIEYRVRPVVRHIVTRFHAMDDGSTGCEPCGEFDNREQAIRVGTSLCHLEEQHHRAFEKAVKGVSETEFTYPLKAQEGAELPLVGSDKVEDA